MSAKSSYRAFLAFMTPGRTLFALLLGFIALPSALVWTGVASFGAGKGAQGSEAGQELKSATGESGAGRAARSEPASKPERASVASSSGGSSSTAMRETSRESRVVAAPAINPGIVTPPMASVNSSPDRSQGPATGAAEVAGSVGASGAAPATSIRSGSGGATPSVLRAVPMQPHALAKSEPSPQDQARGKAAVPPPEKAPQASAADLQLEEKLRAALGARIAAGGQLTITYSGDVVEKPPAQPGGSPSPAGTSGTGKPGGRP